MTHDKEIYYRALRKAVKYGMISILGDIYDTKTKEVIHATNTDTFAHKDPLFTQNGHVRRIGAKSNSESAHVRNTSGEFQGEQGQNY